MDILINALIISLSVMAIWVSFRDGMIFGFVERRMENAEAPHWLKSIVYECPICMVPYYGSILIAYSMFFNTEHHFNFNADTPITILCSMGINTIVTYIIPDL